MKLSFILADCNVAEKLEAKIFFFELSNVTHLYFFKENGKN